LNAARPVRRFRVSVIGHIDLETDDLAPEAVEHSAPAARSGLERYGLQLGVSNLELLGPLD
jgi:hypothetical protein